MMLTDRVARGIASGDVTQVFRRWARPRVRAGATLRTSAGTVGIVGVDQIEAGDITDEDARAAGEPDADAVLAAFRGAAHYPVFRISVRCLGPAPLGRRGGGRRRYPGQPWRRKSGRRQVPSNAGPSGP